MNKRTYHNGDLLWATPTISNLHPKRYTEMQDLTVLVTLVQRYIDYYGEQYPLHLLEIGCNAGMTTYALGDAMKGNGDVTAIDWDRKGESLTGIQATEVLPTDKIGYVARNLENVTILKGNSQTYEYDTIFDIVFIDGDHSYEGVKADYENAKQFAHERTLYLFHDAENGAVPGVAKFLAEQDRDYIVFGRGEAKVAMFCDDEFRGFIERYDYE